MRAADLQKGEETMASFDDGGIQSFRAFIESIQSATHAAATAAAASKIENQDAFDEMRQHVLDLYQGVEARHSFLLEQQVVDCIPIDQQPAVRRFGGPVLAAPPLPEGPPLPDGPLPGQLQPDAKDRFGNPTWCPAGTIPMRRVTLDEMSRFRNLREFLQKSPAGGSRVGDVATGTETHKYATGAMGIPNTGGVSTINVWQPAVQTQLQQLMSLSQQWYYGGSGAALQTVECGWQVQPLRWNTTSPILFCYYTPDNYQSGCYNLECAAFVQTNPSIVLGSALTNISISGGAQTEFMAAYALMQGAWWLYLQGQPVGYYPIALFQGGQLATKALGLQLGGESVGQANWPPMGSGALASEGPTKAAYHKNVWYYDGNPYEAQLSANAVSSCFTIAIVNESGGALWNTYFFFGGPGGTSC
jgi:Neprosin